MNDLDKRLSRAKINPCRELSANFTQKVLLATDAKKRKTGFPDMVSSVWKGHFVYKFSKPATIFASLAVTTLVAGTAYAAVQWMEPNATLDKGAIVTLTNGNKRFWVHTDSCQGQSMEFPIDSYYEIKSGAKTTPEDIRNHVQAECEAGLTAERFPELASSSKKYCRLQSRRQTVLHSLGAD